MSPNNFFKRLTLFAFLSMFKIGFAIGQDSLKVWKYIDDFKNRRGVDNFHKSEIDSCEMGIWDAWSDIRDSNYYIASWGLPADKNSYRKAMLYYQVLEDDYGIKGSHRGCELNMKSSCYSSYMRYRITEIYGNEVFEKAKSKTDSLWSVGMVDREVEFPEGLRGLNKFVACNIQLLDENKREGGWSKSIEVLAQIDEKGNIVSFEFLNQKLEDTEYEKEINRLFESMPDWMPAVKNQKAVPSETRIFFSFDKEYVEDYCK